MGFTDSGEPTLSTGEAIGRIRGQSTLARELGEAGSRRADVATNLSRQQQSYNQYADERDFAYKYSQRPESELAWGFVSAGVAPPPGTTLAETVERLRAEKPLGVDEYLDRERRGGASATVAAGAQPQPSALGTDVTAAAGPGERGLAAGRGAGAGAGHPTATTGAPPPGYRNPLDVMAERNAELGRSVAPFAQAHPELEETLRQWRRDRQANGQNPNDGNAFRQHLIASGMPDPGQWLSDVPQVLNGLQGAFIPPERWDRKAAPYVPKSPDERNLTPEEGKRLEDYQDRSLNFGSGVTGMTQEELDDYEQLSGRANTTWQTGPNGPVPNRGGFQLANVRGRPQAVPSVAPQPGASLQSAVTAAGEGAGAQPAPAVPTRGNPYALARRYEVPSQLTDADYAPDDPRSPSAKARAAVAWDEEVKAAEAAEAKGITPWWPANGYSLRGEPLGASGFQAQADRPSAMFRTLGTGDRINPQTGGTNDVFRVSSQEDRDRVAYPGGVVQENVFGRPMQTAPYGQSRTNPGFGIIGRSTINNQPGNAGSLTGAVNAATGGGGVAPTRPRLPTYAGLVGTGLVRPRVRRVLGEPEAQGDNRLSVASGQAPYAIRPMGGLRFASAQGLSSLSPSDRSSLSGAVSMTGTGAEDYFDTITRRIRGAA